MATTPSEVTATTPEIRRGGKCESRHRNRSYAVAHCNFTGSGAPHRPRGVPRVLLRARRVRVHALAAGFGRHDGVVLRAEHDAPDASESAGRAAPREPDAARGGTARDR